MAPAAQAAAAAAMLCVAIIGGRAMHVARRGLRSHDGGTEQPLHARVAYSAVPSDDPSGGV